MPLSIRMMLGFAASLALGILSVLPPEAGAQTKPDLVVSSLSAPPATGIPGDSFVVSVSVTNKGGAAADVSTTKFFLVSTSPAIVKNLKGVQNVASLAPTAIDKQGVTLTIYSDTVPGAYALLACADGGGKVAESVEGNNCTSTAPDTITVQDTPDLVVTKLSPPPDSVGQGQPFPLPTKVTVWNTGAVPVTVATTVKYYLVSTGDGSRIDLKAKPPVSVPPLGPNLFFKAQQTLTVRAETAPGSYYLQACADSGKAVSEKDENDNCLTLTSIANIVTVSKTADLFVKSVTVAPLSVNVGDPLDITTVVKNGGLAEAPALWTLKFRLVDANNPTAPTKNLKGIQTVQVTMPSGDKQILLTTVQVYDDTVPGVYKVQACADYDKIVPESTESNNCTTALDAVTIAGTPLSQLSDLIVKSVTVTGAPVTVAPGGPVSITAVVGNQGLGDAALSAMKFSLVKAAGAAPIRNLTGLGDVPVVIHGTNQTTLPTVVTVKASTPLGTYFVQGCVDTAQVVEETVESNNCGTSLGTVTVE